jgi:hypothetical protein
MADSPELVQTLSNNLANLPPPTEITSIQEFDTKLKALNNAINDAINKHVKVSLQSPHSKRWWSSDRADAKRKMKRLRGRSKYHRTNLHYPVHEEYRIQRNLYSENIRAAKAEHWLNG